MQANVCPFLCHVATLGGWELLGCLQLTAFMEQEKLEQGKAREAASGMLSRQWFVSAELWGSTDMAALRRGITRAVHGTQ